MTSLKSDVVQLSAQVQQHDQSDFERQLKESTAGRSCRSGAASSAASSEPNPEPAKGNGSMHPPKTNSAGGGRFSLRHGEGRDLQKKWEIFDMSFESRTGGLQEKLISGKGQLPHK